MAVANDSDPPLFTASMEFLKENSWPEEEKPFVILYQPIIDIRMTNIEYERVNGIPIHDLRPKKGKLSLDREGFVIEDFPNPLTYEETFDEEMLKNVYSKSLKDWLLKDLGAKSAYIHECVIRCRGDATAMHKKSGLGVPIENAHGDYTLDEISKIVGQLFPAKANEIRQNRFQIVWRPLRGPLKDWPLALCDLTTLDEDDMIALDEVHKDDVLEGFQLCYRPSQRWYYLKDQLPTELVIFKAGDSIVRGAVPHGSFDNPICPYGEPPRESIEFRILVAY